LEGDRSHRGSTASAGSCPASDSSLTPTNSCYGCCLCIMHLHGHHCCVLTCSHDIHPLMAGLSTSYTWYWRIDSSRIPTRLQRQIGKALDVVMGRRATKQCTPRWRSDTRY
jgi:hypothetical protein